MQYLKSQKKQTKDERVRKALRKKQHVLEPKY